MLLLSRSESNRIECGDTQRSSKMLELKNDYYKAFYCRFHGFLSLYYAEYNQANINTKGLKLAKFELRYLRVITIKYYE